MAPLLALVLAASAPAVAPAAAPPALLVAQISATIIRAERASPQTPAGGTNRTARIMPDGQIIVEFS